jgi:flagellar biosynthesis anti-sigma factor FlgM
MRIDPFNSAASQVSSEASPVAAQNTKTGQAGREDRATLTSDSTSVGSLVGMALSSPEVRQDKVDSLRQAINSGEYDLDPAKTASSMVDEYA